MTRLPIAHLRDIFVWSLRNELFYDYHTPSCRYGGIRMILLHENNSDYISVKNNIYSMLQILWWQWNTSNLPFLMKDRFQIRDMLNNTSWKWKLGKLQNPRKTELNIFTKSRKLWTNLENQNKEKCWWFLCLCPY